MSVAENVKLTTVPVSVEFKGKLITMFDGNEITGAVVSDVTATLSVASAKSESMSVTRKVKLALVAPQVAATFAVTLPDESTAIPETVTPFDVALDAPLTVTLTSVFGIFGIIDRSD